MSTKLIQKLAALGVGAAMSLTACGDGSEPTALANGGVDLSDMEAVAQAACDLTEPAVVAEAFGGSVDSEKPGTSRNCKYAVSGAAAQSVDVFYFGPADMWDSQRSSAKEMAGTEVVDVPGIGEEALRVGGAGGYLMVRADDVVFAVSAFPGGGDFAAETEDLAGRIAESV